MTEPCLRNALAALVAAAVMGRAQAAPASLATLAGTWTVAHVRVDEATSRKTALPPDDPRLVGRTLLVGPADVTLQTLQGPQVCGGAALLPRPGPVAQLLGAGVAPSTYGLPLAADAKVDAVALSCAQGGIGDAAGMGPAGNGETWLLPLADGTLAMRYVDGSVLVLTRGATRASFDCAAAASPAERAICASPELAGLDRSVAAAFGADTRQFQGIGDPAALRKLRGSQKAWLRQRDACGGDDACLRRAMDARVQALGDTQGFTGE